MPFAGFLRFHLAIIQMEPVFPSVVILLKCQQTDKYKNLCLEL